MKRCSIAATEADLQLIGSAPTYDGFLLVEVALPWPRSSGYLPMLAGVQRRAAELRTRVQLVCGPDTDPTRSRIIHYRRGFGARFGRAEYVCEPAELGETALTALSAPVGPATGVELLVCAHGRHDPCCGSKGARLLVEAAGGELDGVRIWRTSHLGGHRFAPTMLSLPDGTYWGRLSTETLAAIGARRGPVSDVLPHYRGCTCAPPRAQHLDQVAFGEHGWAWFGADRSYRLDEDRVRVDVTFPDGQSRSYSATSRLIRTVPIGGCLDPTKIEEYPEYELSDVAADQR